MKNGQTVASFEREFASYVGAKYAIALCNGTATLHTALVALGVKPGDRVATTPLTMSATSIAILQAGAVPVYCDVDPMMWRMNGWLGRGAETYLPVSLYGLSGGAPYGPRVIDDAAQTLRKHDPINAFTSYSFQASKILSLGEGGMLVTDDETLAEQARQFSSLGYWMKADQPRIDPATLKDPSFMRHHSLGWNYRMNDLTAAKALDLFDDNAWTRALHHRSLAANLYRDAIEGCSWATPQYVPEGWSHDMWSFAVALESPKLFAPFTDAIVRHGGERPYACWLPTYFESAFKHLGKAGDCPIAESLQKRIVAFQTNSLESAEKNAKAVRLAIRDMDNSRTPSVFAAIMTRQCRQRPISDATGTPCS